MKERPIIFSGESVKAILDGRKTQTRRVVKPQMACKTVSWGCVSGQGFGFIFTGHEDEVVKCPYGSPGDRLWVRETFYDDLGARSIADGLDSLYYRADGDCCEQIPECQCADVGKPKWRPSIFMPRWASRVTLEITEVRVQRLQDINWIDAIAEGMHDPRRSQLRTDRANPKSPLYEFPRRWDEINSKKHPWDSNPWVWAISFKKHGE